MKHLDMFSGIAGMTVAVKQISSAAGYCDHKTTAQGSLERLIRRKKLTAAIIIKEADDIPKHFAKGSIDMITAGFPCTGFSVCGKGEGFAHPESSAFSSLIKACKHLMPGIVFLENSPVVYDSLVIRTQVENALKRLGYMILHCKVKAKHVGLPHCRNRWFALAFTTALTKSQSLKLSKTLVVHKPYAEPARTTDTIQVGVCNRFDLLKNAVIPACATLALKSLLKSHSTGMTQGEVTCSKIARPLDLIFRQGQSVFKKQFWPTLHGSWRRGASVMNERNIRDIHTAIKFETSTKSGHVNVEWLEWLMGFPRGWTATL